MEGKCEEEQENEESKGFRKRTVKHCCKNHPTQQTKHRCRQNMKGKTNHFILPSSTEEAKVDFHVLLPSCVH